MSSGKDILSMSAEELRGLVLQVQAVNPGALHQAQTQTSTASSPPAAHSAADAAAGGGSNAPELAAAHRVDRRSRWADRLRSVDEASFRASRTRKETQKVAKVNSVVKKWTMATKTTNQSAKTAVPQTEQQASVRPPPSRKSSPGGRHAKKQKVNSPAKGKETANETQKEQGDGHSIKTSETHVQKEKDNCREAEIASQSVKTNETANESQEAGDEHSIKTSKKASASKKTAPHVPSPTIMPSRNRNDIAPPEEEEYENRNKMPKKDNVPLETLSFPAYRVEYRSTKSLERTSLVSSGKQDASGDVPYWDTVGKCRLPRHHFAWPEREKALGYDAALGRVYHSSFSLLRKKYDVGDFVLRNKCELFRIVAAYQATKSFLGAWSELDKNRAKPEKIPQSKKEEIQKRGHPYMLVCPLFPVDTKRGVKGASMAKVKEVYLGPDTLDSPCHIDMLPQWLGEADLKLTKVEVKLRHDGETSCMGFWGMGEKYFCGKVGLAGPGRSLMPLEAQHVSLLSSSASDLIRKGHIPKSWDSNFEAEQVQFILKDRPNYISRDVQVHYTAESSDDSDGFDESSSRKLGCDSEEDSEEDTETEDDTDPGENDHGKSGSKIGAMAPKKYGRKSDKVATAEIKRNTGTPNGSKYATSADTLPSVNVKDDLEFVDTEQPESPPVKRVAMISRSNDAAIADPMPSTDVHAKDDLEFVDTEQPESPPVKRVATISRSTKKIVAGRKKLDFDEGKKARGELPANKKPCSLVENLEFAPQSSRIHKFKN